VLFGATFFEWATWYVDCCRPAAMLVHSWFRSAGSRVIRLPFVEGLRARRNITALVSPRKVIAPVAAVGLLLAACGTARPPAHARLDVGCSPRGLDDAPVCPDGKAPTPNDRVTRYVLNGPVTSGDQFSGRTCFGLLLELEYASGAHCRQLVANFSSIGMGDEVLLDDEPACFHLSKDTLAIERAGVVVAATPRLAGMDTARSYPLRCKE
jgi:hypothetical protein